MNKRRSKYQSQLPTQWRSIATFANHEQQDAVDVKGDRRNLEEVQAFVDG